MRNSAVSVFVLGLYLVITGLGFIFIPNLLLGILALLPTYDVWIHIIGLLLVIIGYYCLQMARRDQVLFVKLTVHARIMVFLFFTFLTVFKLAPPIMIIFGLIDLFSALWTFIALRSESETAFRL